MKIEGNKKPESIEIQNGKNETQNLSKEKKESQVQNLIHAYLKL